MTTDFSKVKDTQWQYQPFEQGCKLTLNSL